MLSTRENSRLTGTFTDERLRKGTAQEGRGGYLVTDTGISIPRKAPKDCEHCKIIRKYCDEMTERKIKVFNSGRADELTNAGHAH